MHRPSNDRRIEAPTIDLSSSELLAVAALLDKLDEEFLAGATSPDDMAYCITEEVIISVGECRRYSIQRDEDSTWVLCQVLGKVTEGGGDE